MPHLLFTLLIAFVDSNHAPTVVHGPIVEPAIPLVQKDGVIPPAIWAGVFTIGLLALATVRMTDRESESTGDRYSIWLETQDCAAVVTDRHGNVLAANAMLEAIIPDWRDSAASQTALPEQLKSGSDDIENSDVIARLSQTIKRSAPPNASTFTLSYRNLESLEVTLSPQFDDQGMISCWLWSLRDNSDDHRLQQHHEHSEKMQAITRLAGGMAHEFNNLLTAILGNLELMRMYPERVVSDVASNIESAEVAALRASQLIHELRTFASRDVPAQLSQSVSPVVRKVRRILAGVAPEKVSVTYQINCVEEPFAIVNAERLEDALLKIGINAIHSIAGKAGAVTLAVGIKHFQNMPPMVTISITDTGQELSESAAEKAFEPFAESSDPNDAAGLGMAMAYGLIEEMSGTVTIGRSTRSGNEFTVSLPLSEQSDGDEMNSDSDIVRSPYRLSIAVLDSESSVRKVARGMLRLLGHNAITFDSGRGFITAVEQGETFDLVMMDNAMPGMSGRQTYEQFRQFDVDVPVIICSGRSIDLSTFCPNADRPPEGFVSKPFSIEDLSTIIAPYA